MKRRRSGQATIEFALLYSAVILPLTFMAVFVSEMLWVWHSVVDFTRDGANYAATHCWMGDGSNVTAALQFGITGTADGSAAPLISNLTADMITVTTQCIDPVPLALGDCSVSGCGTPAGGQRPDFITVSMPNGYIIQPRIPYILLDPIPLKPKAVMAYGGAS